MPKPTAADVAQLANSLKRAKEIFATKQTDPFGAMSARAYGYLEMAVERFLESGKRKGAK